MSDLDELVDALRGAQRSVFRLEARQDYPDDMQWQAFIGGHDWEKNDDLAAWTELVRSNVARGVMMRRVHVVTRPWTPYVRFEVEQHYPHNREAGEDVRLVQVEDVWDAPDFWMVDDRRAWLLVYDTGGRMTVVRAAEDALVVLRQWRDQALAGAVGLHPRLPA
ncbi:MAG: DUF6879 family protein [Pseudonocardia sp.]